MKPKREAPRKFLGALTLLALSAVVLGLPCFWLARLLAASLGWNETASALAGSVAWFLVVYLLLIFFFRVMPLLFRWRYRNKPHPHQHRDRPVNQYDEVINALERIAKGDYNVLVAADEHQHFSEIAKRINHMASELSSVEALRQDFVANVSHEIQSPLTSIQGFATLLKKSNLSEEQREHYLSIIQHECTRLSRLSDNLLRLTQLDNGAAPYQPQPYRLDKQLQETLLVLEPQWAIKNIAMELEADPITLNGDRDLLEQVWINLLHNAIKFTPEQGAITVTVTTEEGKVYCRVEDSGPGIPEDNLGRLFERFYTADKARTREAGGNGLGLSIAHKIVSLHGGEISAENLPKGGACFFGLFAFATRLVDLLFWSWLLCLISAFGPYFLVTKKVTKKFRGVRSPGPPRRCGGLRLRLLNSKSDMTQSLNGSAI